MSKQEYIALINEELLKIENEYYLIIIYLLVAKYNK